jgi:predicted nucleic acid-binding protein
MIAGYLIDTNCYIRAQRELGEQSALLDFLDRAAEPVLLSSVVLAGLRAGTRSADGDRLFAPERLREWLGDSGLVTPGPSAWMAASRVFAALRGDGDRLRMSRGFAFDVLLAASCVEHNLALITHNQRDMARIAAVMPFVYAAPYPMDAPYGAS